MGYRSDSNAVSRDVGPLRVHLHAGRRKLAKKRRRGLAAQQCYLPIALHCADIAAHRAVRSRVRPIASQKGEGLGGGIASQASLSV